MKTLLTLLVGIIATVTMAGDVTITLRPRDDYGSVGLGVGNTYTWHQVKNPTGTVVTAKSVIKNVEDIRVREDAKEVRVFAGGKQFALRLTELPPAVQAQCKAAIPKPKN
jgi:hypothetical protein